MYSAVECIQCMYRLYVCKYAPGMSISFHGNYSGLGMGLGVSLQFLLLSNLLRKISHEFWIFRSLVGMYKDDETFGELGIACYSNNRISKKKLTCIDRVYNSVAYCQYLRMYVLY